MNTDIYEELKNELTTKFEAKDMICDSAIMPENPSDSTGVKPKKVTDWF